MRDYEVFVFALGMIGTVQARSRKAAEKAARNLWPELGHQITIVEPAEV